MPVFPCIFLHLWFNVSSLQTNIYTKMKEFFMHEFQLSMFYDLQVFVQPPTSTASTITCLGPWIFHPCPTATTVFRPATDIPATPCSGLIVKHLEGIKSIPRLLEFLDAHPVLTDLCGFQIGSFPDDAQFTGSNRNIPMPG